MQFHMIWKVMEPELPSTQRSLARKGDVASSAELKSEIAVLCMEIKAMEKRLARWILTCFIGQTAVLAALGYFTLTHLRR